MSKKYWILIAVAVVFAGVYAVFFTDWFRSGTIKIHDTSRPIRLRGQTNPATAAVIFILSDYYDLTEIKVVPLAALQTNKLAKPVWHLVSDSGSDDVNNFVYGQTVSGMDPAIEGVQPEPLQPGVTYRIFVAAGKVKGQHDFHIGAAPADTVTNR